MSNNQNNAGSATNPEFSPATLRIMNIFGVQPPIFSPPANERQIPPPQYSTNQAQITTLPANQVQNIPSQANQVQNSLPTANQANQPLPPTNARLVYSGPHRNLLPQPPAHWGQRTAARVPAAPPATFEYVEFHATRVEYKENHE